MGADSVSGDVEEVGRRTSMFVDLVVSCEYWRAGSCLRRSISLYGSPPVVR